MLLAFLSGNNNEDLTINVAAKYIFVCLSSFSPALKLGERGV